MKWFRKSLLWMSVGCFGAVAAAQEPIRRDAAPLPDSSPRGPSLGRPAPLPSATSSMRVVALPAGDGVVNASATVPPWAKNEGTIRQTSFSLVPQPFVARGARPLSDEDPGGLLAPKLPAPRPVEPPKDILFPLATPKVLPVLQATPKEAAPMFVVPKVETPAALAPKIATPANLLESREPVTLGEPRATAQPAQPKTESKLKVVSKEPQWAAPQPGKREVVHQIIVESGSDSAFFAQDGHRWPLLRRLFGSETPGNAMIVPGSERIIFEGGCDVFQPVPCCQRVYAGAEALLWWTRGSSLPPLVTTAPSTDPENTRGTLGFGGTQLLYGDQRTSSGPDVGGRFTLGYTFDPCCIWSIEGSFFFLGRNNDNAFFSGAVLGRPFFNVNVGQNDRELTSSPGTTPGDLFALRGTTTIENSRNFFGADLNLKKLLCQGCNYRVTGLAGFRYLDLNEGLHITENVISDRDVAGFPGIFSPGNQITVFDHFDTHNRFYGGQVGIAGERRQGRWTFAGSAKIGLGVTNQQIDINGGQSVLSAADGTRRNFQGGLLALPSNIGHFTQNRFSVVPEIGVKLGYNLTDNLRVTVGYDFLYWSNVVRPGDQIDTSLNVAQIPNFLPQGQVAPAGPIRPLVPFRTTDFWAQGFNAGLELRY